MPMQLIYQLKNLMVELMSLKITKKRLIQTLKKLKKVNNSLLFNENNKLVSNRLDRVIDILNEVCEIKEEGPQINNLMYYKMNKLNSKLAGGRK